MCRTDFVFLKGSTSKVQGELTFGIFASLATRLSRRTENACKSFVKRGFGKRNLTTALMIRTDVAKMINAVQGAPASARRKEDRENRSFSRGSASGR